jgi:exopolysaccharide biosynthesis protein
VPVHLVVADLNDPEVKIGVMVARDGIGSTESFASMIHRAQPAAAITGTFFGIHNGLPTGDLVVNGHALYQGFVGTAVAFTEGNRVSFIPVGYKEKRAWQSFDGVMRGGPMLVQSGTIAVGPREEGFVSISPAARRQRTAVGITPGRKLLLLAVRQPISLWRLAKLMRSLGAYHAVAMDGGSSTGLYFHGQMVVQPARALTNSLVVYANPVRYHQARRTFVGRSQPPAAARPPSPPTPAIAIQIQPAIGGRTPGSSSD